MSLVGVNNAKMNDVNLLTGKENTVIKRDILNFDSPSIFTKENDDNNIYKNHLPMRLLDLDDLENDDDYYKVPDTNIKIKKQPREEAMIYNPIKDLSPNTIEEPNYKNPILEDPEQPGKPIFMDPGMSPFERFPKEIPAPIQDKNFLATQTLEDVEAA